MGRYFNSIALMCVLLLCWTSSCIYPFEADVKDAGSRLVIEGDIILGHYTEVKLSYMFPLGTSEAEMLSKAPMGNAWVEDDAGVKYQNTRNVPSSGLSTFTIDTREASDQRSYRLHVKVYDTDKEYVSAWKTASPAPVVDDISFIRDADSTNVHVALSAHSDDGCQYFRWTYRETWKYHADYLAYYAFDDSDTTVVELPDVDYSTYWCWAEKSSNEIDLCATTDLTSDRLVNHKFLKFSRSSHRFHERYRISIELRTISADAYRYLANLKLVSNYTGSLFSANPSDVTGNITCLDDPEEMVIGYIDVGLPVTFTKYLDKASRFYRPGGSRYRLFVPEFELSDGETYEDALYNLWRTGYIPIEFGVDYLGKTGVMWEHKRCTDCRTDGGKLEKPVDWEE